jgi:catechol 2,3-dioxygenase-like lactoylglutathione lyase family enzyme
MKAAINFITIAVTDLERSVAFYRDGLGWKTDGIMGSEFSTAPSGDEGEHGIDYSVAMFDMGNGLLLCLWTRENLAKDARIEPGTPGGAGFSLGIPAANEAEVDAMLAEAEKAGATVTAPAAMAPFGVYTGYFTDPDGNLWEVAWNPHR